MSISSRASTSGTCSAKRPFTLLCLALILLTLSPTAFAEDDDGDERPYSSLVVQNRKHFGAHEFNVSLGVLALDAFTKGITASGSYTIHFNDSIGWEVAQYAHSFHVDTELKSELETFELKPTPFELLDSYVMSNLLIKPIYWKGSVFNENIIYGEMFFVVGGGYGWFTRSNRPGVDVGIGLRFYSNELLSFRLDTRYLAFFDDSILDSLDTKDDLWISLGTSLTF